MRTRPSGRDADHGCCSAAYREAIAIATGSRIVSQDGSQSGRTASERLLAGGGQRSHLAVACSQPTQAASDQARKASLESRAAKADRRLRAEDSPQLISMCDADWRASRGVAG